MPGKTSTGSITWLEVREQLKLFCSTDALWREGGREGGRRRRRQGGREGGEGGREGREEGREGGGRKREKRECILLQGMYALIRESVHT